MSSSRRSHRDRGYDKHTSKRPKRGVNANDIEKIQKRNFRIIDNSNNNIPSPELQEIVTKESDKTIQIHQKTRTLHKKQNISVPDFRIIRHELPNKSINPSLKIRERDEFKLTSSYIQYSTINDRGYVSFNDFYDLKKDDIDWLINELKQHQINEIDNPLINAIDQQYQRQKLIYKHKLDQSLQKKQLKEKEHSVLSQNSSNSNSLSNESNEHKKRHKTRSTSPKKEKKLIIIIIKY